MSAKRKNLKLVEKLRLIKESKAKSKRNLATRIVSFNMCLQVYCISGTSCVHEHISPLLGEHPCIVNIFLGPVTVHYREVSLYLYLYVKSTFLEFQKSENCVDPDLTLYSLKMICASIRYHLVDMATYSCTRSSPWRSDRPKLT